MPNVIEIQVKATNLTGATFDEVRAKARTIGEGVGSDFSKGVRERVVEDAPAWGGEAGRTAGERAGFDFTQAMGGRVRQELPPQVEKPLEDSGKKGGKAAGAAAAGGISPLIVGAFTAAATVGPAVLLAGTATAVVGIAALLAKSNAQIAADYQTLGQQVQATLSGAVSQITPQIDAGVKTLEAGVTTLGPQLDQLFASVGPDATQLASGLVQLAQGALPGIVSGVKEFAPEMHDVAEDAGKLGQGLGGFIDKLGGGAGGATTGLNALTKAASELLPDLGEITADLSNGLGPALRDVLTVATPVANVLTDVVHAIPPGEIEVAAVAVTALYTAFKIGTLTKLVGEGTTFIQFLQGTTVASEAATVATAELGVAEEATAVKTGLMATAQEAATATTGALSTAVSAAAGPYGALAAALFVATDYISTHTKIQLNLFTVISTLNKAYNTHATSVGTAAKAVAGIAGNFTSAAGRADQLTSALTTQREQISGNAQTTAQSTLAALGATDGQSKLVQQLYQTLTGYSAATTGASAYSTALTALNGTTTTLDDAQNSLAQQMLNAKTSFAQNGYSLDLNTQAGINNRDALSAAAKAITQLGTAQYQATGDINKANGTIQDQINQFVKNTGATGKNKDAIYQYLESLAKIPPDVTTTVHVQTNIDYAYKQVNSLMNYINSQTGFISIGTGTGHGFGAQATGGPTSVSYAAVGGPRQNLTWINEQGAELVHLPSGATVIPHADVDSMIASGKLGGGGPAMGGSFELSVAPGSDGAVATMIMTLVRLNKLTIKQKAIVP